MTRKYLIHGPKRRITTLIAIGLESKPRARSFNVLFTPSVAAALLRSSLRSAGSRGSFDHLVGTAKQVQRERKTECFGGLQVDDKLDLCRLLYRQVSGLLA